MMYVESTQDEDADSISAESIHIEEPKLRAWCSRFWLKIRLALFMLALLFISFFAGVKYSTRQYELPPASDLDAIETATSSASPSSFSSHSSFLTSRPSSSLISKPRMHDGETSTLPRRRKSVEPLHDGRIFPTQKIQWLHFPKCGTSFINCFYHSWCPWVPPDVKAGNFGHYNGSMKAKIFSKFYPWEKWCNVTFNRVPQGHHVLIPGLVTGAIAMFRHPGARMVSAFHYGLNSNGFEEPMYEKLRHVVYANENEDDQIKAYATFPGIGNCQTKMILGEKCASTYKVTKGDFKRALKLVEQFLFKGITDEWSRSICLFHKRFNIGEILDVELQNARPGNYSRIDHDKYVFKTDSFDNRLFKVVSKEIHSEFRKHGC